MGMNKGEFLGRVGLFHDLALRERHDIEGLFCEQRMERDQVIFLEGDAA
jgi:hypothetical protein